MDEKPPKSKKRRKHKNKFDFSGLVDSIHLYSESEDGETEPVDYELPTGPREENENVDLLDFLYQLMDRLIQYPRGRYRVVDLTLAAKGAILGEIEREHVVRSLQTVLKNQRRDLYNPIILPDYTKEKDENGRGRPFIDNYRCCDRLDLADKRGQWLIKKAEDIRRGTAAGFTTAANIIAGDAGSDTPASPDDWLDKRE